MAVDRRVLFFGDGDEKIMYLPNKLAARHGASAARPTSVLREAYADWGWDFTPTRLAWPPA